MNSTQPRATSILIEAVIVGLVFTGLLGFSAFLVYSKSLNAMDEEIKIGLLSTVRSAATTIDGTLHRSFDADTPPDDPIYQSQAQPLEYIRQATRDVRYLYTNILVDGEVFFVINPSPQNDGDGDGEPDAPPRLMDPYPDHSTELFQALSEGREYVSEVPYTDEWGTFISAYAPFYDDEGKLVGTLGMDLELAGFYKRLANIQNVFEKASITIVFLGLIIGLAFWYLRRTHFKQLRDLFELERANSDAKRHHTNSFAEANGLRTRLTTAYGAAQIEREEYLSSQRNIDVYAQSYLAESSEEESNFKLEELVKDLEAIGEGTKRVSFKSEGPLPEQISGDRDFLLDLFGDLLKSLALTAGSEIRFTLSQNDELLNQFELKNTVEIKDKAFLTRLYETLKNEAGIFVEAHPGKMNDEERAWLEVKRLGRLLTHVDAALSLGTDPTKPCLVILWKVNKMDEDVQ